jgi:hypothetical protein
MLMTTSNGTPFCYACAASGQNHCSVEEALARRVNKAMAKYPPNLLLDCERRQVLKTDGTAATLPRAAF